MDQNQASSNSSPLTLVLFWLYVGIPLVWGVSSTMKQAMILFK